MLRVPREARKGSHDKSCEMRIFKWHKIINSYGEIVKRSIYCMSFDKI